MIKYLLVIIFIIFLFFVYNQNMETFDTSIIQDDCKQINVDIIHFFQFMEYFQLHQLDQSSRYMSADMYREVEYNRIEENIKSLLNLFRLLFKSNKYPNSFILKNHYISDDININLQQLKNLLESNNLSSKYSILIKRIILSTINTDIYKEYLTNNKFDLKYSGIIFNPYMIKISAGL